MPNWTIDDERAAFDAQLEALLEEHEGKIALFHEGTLVDVFDDEGAAYQTGLQRFGSKAVFLVTRVAPPSSAPISIAWSAGVMFG